jgi:hypothetical protein
MINFEHLIAAYRQSGFLHHAILVERSHEALAAVREFVEKDIGMAITGNPDVFIIEGESLGIDEARELRRRQEMGALEGSRKIFIVAVHTMTSEAQNALLKTLEEPTEGTHLFFIVPHAEALLPTLRSRMVRVALAPRGEADDNTALAKAFLQAKTPAERMHLLKPLLDAKDKAQAAAFFDRLIAQLRPDPAFPSVQAASVLTDLLRARSYLAGRSPSVKILLEHVSGTLGQSSVS